MDGIDRSLFFFGEELFAPLKGILIEGRNEADYYKNQGASLAMEALYAGLAASKAKAFLITVEPAPSFYRKLKSKKGLLWSRPSLSSLPYETYEIMIGNAGMSSLAAWVDLNDFEFRSDSDLILNWCYSFIVITREDDIDWKSKIPNWIGKNSESSDDFDFTLIFRDLVSLKRTGILRYFPPDNGRNEMISFLCSNSSTCTEFSLFLSVLRAALRAPFSGR